MNKILNLNNTCVEYLPGNSAYGQHGCSGLTGDLGNSIYYASYLYQDSSALLISQIKEGKAFTNNESFVEDASIEYLEKDLIIDLGGNVYCIEKLNKDKWESNPPQDPYISSVGSIFKTTETIDLLDASINLIIEEDNIQIVKNNPYFVNLISCPKEMYLDRSVENIGCVGIDFVFTDFPETKNNYNFIFYVQLPNGELLSTQKNVLEKKEDGLFHEIIYIDNRYIYSTLSAEDSSTIKSYKGTSWYGITKNSTNENEEDYIENLFKVSSSAGDVHDIIKNIIVNYCKSLTIYYEIINAKTGEIYKKYMEIS